MASVSQIVGYIITLHIVVLTQRKVTATFHTFKQLTGQDIVLPHVLLVPSCFQITAIKFAHKFVPQIC